MKRNPLRGLLLSCVSLVVTMMLTGCSTSSQDGPSSARLYSNEYLYFQKGQEVQTRKGVVKFQVDADYVAKWKYEEKEQDCIALISEIRKLEAERLLNK